MYRGPPFLLCQAKVPKVYTEVGSETAFAAFDKADVRKFFVIP